MPAYPYFEEFYADHPEMLDRSAGRLFDLAVASERALADGRIEIPRDRGIRSAEGDLIEWPPESFDLTAFQTGFKGQGGRDTCYSFCAIAAMEAAYWRQFHISLDLSEQYAFHLNKVTELVGNYLTTSRPENNSSMWGFQGNSFIVDKLTRWAIPDETASPYLDDTAMTNILALTGVGPLTETMSTQENLDTFEFDERHIPLNARYQCRYRVRSFAALPANPTSSDIERVIASGHEVVADIPQHCVLIVGYDRPARQYIVKDSLNPRSFQTMSYDGPLTVLGGRYITAVEAPLPPRRDSMWLGRWNLERDGWRGELVIRRTSYFGLPATQPTKIGNYYTVGLKYEVNGWFEDDYRILHAWIANTEGKVAPGTLTGQEFCFYLMDADPLNAAGWTDVFGTRYGATLSRLPLPPVNRQDAFEIHRWVGNWDFSHDGWKGVLTLQSFHPARGTYNDGHNVFQAEGNHSVHGLTLDIVGLQRFDLFMHTNNTDMASGTTTAHGRTFGVNLRRRPFVPTPPVPVSPDVFVPGVVSLPHDEAYSVLAGAGYGVSTHWEWSSGEPEGNVSDQQPAAGALDLPPTVVHIWVRTLPPEPPPPPDPTVIVESDALKR